MKISASIQSITTFFVSVLLSTSALTATAQNYYPAEIGNEWILESTDKGERQTYTLEVPEDIADEELILLKIETKNIDTGNLVDTDKYYLSDTTEGIKLHKTNLQTKLNNIVFTATANLTSPAVFFPKVLEQEGQKWDIVTDAKVGFHGAELDVKSTTNLEIVGFEPVETSVGTFRNCAKIQLNLSITGALNLQSTSYQWLAPGVGPVKFQNSDGIDYLITSFKRSPPAVIIAQNPPVWSLPNKNITVIGTRLGGILNAKILENVENYVSEVENLGIASVSGNIVAPGDGTGFTTNSERKQDLWVAGRFENAPITGTIILFAENNKGRTEEIITVTIDVSP